MELVIYDVEICSEVKKPGDWKRISCNWFGSAVAYSYDTDQYSFFLHSKGLDSLRTYLNRARVVTFNGVNFDSKVILGRERKINSYKGTKPGIFIGNSDLKWLEYDLYVQVLRGYFKLDNDMAACRRISPGGFRLDDIAKATLGISKSGDGAEAPRLYRRQLYGDLLAYNLQDVRVLRALFEHAQKSGFVIGKNRQRVKIERASEWSI